MADTAWWRSYVVDNPEYDGDQNKRKHKCAILGCKYQYNALATRAAGHILGNDKNVRACAFATEEDKILASEKTHRRKSIVSGTSSSASQSIDTTMQEEERCEEPPKSQEQTRTHLNELWTKAFAKCGLAPNVIDDPDFREAILETNKARHQYQPLGRRTMAAYELPKLKAAVKSQLDDLFTGDKAETLVLDGWDNSAKDSLINFLLASLAGEEFLDDEEVTGEEKTAELMANLVVKYVNDGSQGIGA
ncbi:hypothetical protein CYMTET_47986 [Cymbomonas tetramitiformis]|uniref:DUF659 domain-containing protein n=1 Tax=Cymbomonas tetramitiformis TaxID=36881 RepID=A0AAE0BUQ5_9CHLO|nr:hypothetical protein CYMTET_47986 [Cymbomonas tetramitiformis]|eukprot:gene30016-37469_t